MKVIYVFSFNFGYGVMLSVGYLSALLDFILAHFDGSLIALLSFPEVVLGSFALAFVLAQQVLEIVLL